MKLMMTVFSIVCAFSVSVQAQAASFTIADGAKSIEVKRSDLKGSWVYNAHGFVAKLQNIPDPETGYVSTTSLPGEWISAAGENVRTRRVAVAVHHRYFAASDFSSVFVINRDNGARTLVRWSRQGMPLEADGSTRAFSYIDSVSYTAEGYLNVFHSDASGSRARVRFDPNLKFLDCVYVHAAEGRNLCGEF